MNILMTLAVILVALAHLGFLILEMFLWTKPIGLKILGMKEEQARKTQWLAQHIGLYNGLLAAGLLWALWQASLPLLLFILLFIIVAGVYGGMTGPRIIILLQAVPAMIALALVLLNL